MDERAAITQLKQSDISGLETLVRQHYFQAVRTAYLITHNVAQAEDVVQPLFCGSMSGCNSLTRCARLRPGFRGLWSTMLSKRSLAKVRVKLG